MKTIFYNGKIHTPEGFLNPGYVLVDETGLIKSVSEGHFEPNEECYAVNLNGNFLVPGFIDIHFHGACGVNFETDWLPEKTGKAAGWLVKNGVTGYLRTFCAHSSTALTDLIKKHVQNISRQSENGARCLGFHLEGPFLSLEKKGAFNPDWLHAPNLEEIQAYLKAGQGLIRQVTIAPELENAFQAAEYLKSNGVAVALGHTNINYDQAEEALKQNFSHVTHIFNAMRGFSHREPGVVGAVFNAKNITVEIIGDLVHVHPAAIQVLIRNIGMERIVLVSDAMAAAGMPDGVYHLAGHQVFVSGQIARLENGTLAGSATTILDCVRNMVNQVGVPLFAAVNMGSINPAQAMGLDERYGSITPNKEGNVLVLDQDLRLNKTFIKGKLVYQN